MTVGGSFFICTWMTKGCAFSAGPNHASRLNPMNLVVAIPWETLHPAHKMTLAFQLRQSREVLVAAEKFGVGVG